jgi:hypothetical protein
MIVASSEVASLLHRWEVLEYVSEGFVIVGCIGELIADFFTRLPEQLRKHIGTWSTIVLILALSVGLKCLIKTNELSGSVIGSLGDKAEESDKKAQTAIVDSSTALFQAKDALAEASAAENSLGKAEDDANQAQAAASNALSLARGVRQEADSFEKDIVSAKTQAAEAESHLADALQRTKRLEQQLSWRTVTPEQKLIFRKVLLSFRPILPLRNLKINILYANQNPEAEEYAHELKDALDGLGAEISEPNGAEFISSKTIQGLMMTVNPFRDPQGAALLRAFDTATIPIDWNGNVSIDRHSIGLTVGSKPRN